VPQVTKELIICRQQVLFVGVDCDMGQIFYRT
jgi:hypothetical protein